jgi:uncharacterized protein
MHTFTGEAATTDASRIMRRLCKHWGHKYPVECNDTRGVIQLNDVRVVLLAEPQHLSVTLENPEAPVPERLKGVVAEHLQRMAGDAILEVRWSA